MSTNPLPAPQPERRRRDRTPRVHHGPHVQLVLALPDHRLRPGQTVAYTGLDGEDRVVTLPEWTSPGHAVRLVTTESYGWPRQVELVITPS